MIESGGACQYISMQDVTDLAKDLQGLDMLTHKSIITKPTSAASTPRSTLTDQNIPRQCLISDTSNYNVVSQSSSKVQLTSEPTSVTSPPPSPRILSSPAPNSPLRHSRVFDGTLGIADIASTVKIPLHQGLVLSKGFHSSLDPNLDILGHSFPVFTDDPSSASFTIPAHGLGEQSSLLVKHTVTEHQLQLQQKAPLMVSNVQMECIQMEHPTSMPASNTQAPVIIEAISDDGQLEPGPDPQILSSSDPKVNVNSMLASSGSQQTPKSVGAAAPGSTLPTSTDQCSGQSNLPSCSAPMPVCHDHRIQPALDFIRERLGHSIAQTTSSPEVPKVLGQQVQQPQNLAINTADRHQPNQASDPQQVTVSQPQMNYPTSLTSMSITDSTNGLLGQSISKIGCFKPQTNAGLANHGVHAPMVSTFSPASANQEPLNHQMMQTNRAVSYASPVSLLNPGSYQSHASIYSSEQEQATWKPTQMVPYNQVAYIQQSSRQFPPQPYAIKYRQQSTYHSASLMQPTVHIRSHVQTAAVYQPPNSFGHPATHQSYQSRDGAPNVFTPADVQAGGGMLMLDGNGNTVTSQAVNFNSPPTSSVANPHGLTVASAGLLHPRYAEGAPVVHKQHQNLGGGLIYDSGRLPGAGILTDVSNASGAPANAAMWQLATYRVQGAGMDVGDSQKQLMLAKDRRAGALLSLGQVAGVGSLQDPDAKGAGGVVRTNAKGALQELYQKAMKTSTTVVLKYSHRMEAGGFIASVTLPALSAGLLQFNEFQGTGYGRSKKEAEQAAANDALRQLESMGVRRGQGGGFVVFHGDTVYAL